MKQSGGKQTMVRALSKSLRTAELQDSEPLPADCAHQLMTGTDEEGQPLDAGAVFEEPQTLWPDDRAGLDALKLLQADLRASAAVRTVHANSYGKSKAISAARKPLRRPTGWK